LFEKGSRSSGVGGFIVVSPPIGVPYRDPPSVVGTLVTGISENGPSDIGVVMYYFAYVICKLKF
jgi:hypothetical protein